MTARDVYLRRAARQARPAENNPSASDPMTAVQGGEIIDMLKAIIALQKAILNALRDLRRD